MKSFQRWKTNKMIVEKRTKCEMNYCVRWNTTNWGKKTITQSHDRISNKLKHNFLFRTGVGKLFVRRATFEKNVAAEGCTLSLQNRKVYSLCKKTRIYIKHSFFISHSGALGRHKNPAFSDGFNVRGGLEQRLFLILTVLDLFYLRILTSLTFFFVLFFF